MEAVVRSTAEELIVGDLSKHYFVFSLNLQTAMSAVLESTTVLARDQHLQLSVSIFCKDKAINVLVVTLLDTSWIKQTMLLVKVQWSNY